MRRVLVAPISFGIGDLVVSLPAIQALTVAGNHRAEQAWLLARSPAQRRLAPRIGGLAGCVDEASFLFDDRDQLMDLRDHPIQRNFWWGSAAFEKEFGPLDINDILQRICDDMGIAADFSRPIPLDAHPRPELSHSVLLVTETDGVDKTWPAERWAAIAVELVSMGLEVRQVTRSGCTPAMRATGITELHVPTLGDAVDVLTSCRAVIGVDTGLTHIAVQQGTPTVHICRRGSVYFRPWDHCRVLRGDRCTDECLAGEAAYAYNERVSLRDFRPHPRACPSGVPCMNGTTPERATALIEELL
ncbi:MAG: glycosyltransferase family 9 protein [Acidimicrobiales bacterium]|nr:glycosyltransferase family 9 protein [Acidimicrobiales bacterium]